MPIFAKVTTYSEENSLRLYSFLESINIPYFLKVIFEDSFYELHSFKLCEIK